MQGSGDEDPLCPQSGDATDDAFILDGATFKKYIDAIQMCLRVIESNPFSVTEIQDLFLTHRIKIGGTCTQLSLLSKI